MPTEGEARPIEQDLEELQKIVAKLEEDKLGLAESIALFEQGVALSAAAKQKIEDAETKVELLTKRGGKVEPEPFER